MIEVGTIIAGKLRVERLLGRGGMGVVVVATHLQLGQSVAVKVLRDDLGQDHTTVERFLREGQASARLRSEHVCRVFDVGTLESGAPYLVMELLEGADLASVIERRPLPIAQAVDYVLQACEAIGEAHAQGIIHRDLKPANLFVCRRLDGSTTIKVLDFGIAKAAGASELQLTGTATAMGSPAFMSPEQMRSARDVDARTDIWALGAILYQCVSSRLPFPAASITELTAKVLMDPPEPLRVEPRFDAIVMRCLEKDPARRYPTVAALAQDLATYGNPATAPGLAHTVASTLQTLAPRAAAPVSVPLSGAAPSRRPLAIGAAVVAGAAIVAIVASRGGGAARDAGPQPIVLVAGGDMGGSAQESARKFSTALYEHRCDDARAAAVNADQLSRVDSCVPLEKKPFPHTTAGAQVALSSRDPKQALAIAEDLLALHPGDQALLQVAGMSACYLHDTVKANRYVPKLTALNGIKTFTESCRQLGVKIE